MHTPKLSYEIPKNVLLQKNHIVGYLLFKDMWQTLIVGVHYETSIVVSYKGNFKILSNKIVGLSESHKLSCFLSGLKDEIRLTIRMLVPKSLNEAFGLAKIQEEY